MIPEFEKAGIGMAAIGNGTVLMAQDFKSSFDIPFPLYTDPGRQSYSWMNLKRNIGASLSLKMLSRGMKASRSGHKQGKTQGHVLQQGGEALFDTAGQKHWHYISQSPGDHASEAELERPSVYFRRT